MLEEGVYTSVSEIGDAENISKSYVSRILRLALLAPDIIEALLAGRADGSPMLEQLGRPLPASWEEQRRKIFTPRQTTYRPLDCRACRIGNSSFVLGVST